MLPVEGFLFVEDQSKDLHRGARIHDDRPQHHGVGAALPPQGGARHETDARLALQALEPDIDAIQLVRAVLGRVAPSQRNQAVGEDGERRGGGQCKAGELLELGGELAGGGR